MKILGFNFLTPRQIIFLNKNTRGEWTLNKNTGLVNIKGDFDCSGGNLTDFKGVKFGVVTGNFRCDNNKLTSLVGAPQEVTGNFHCSFNKRISLVGAPQEVGGSFDCSYNKLTSLEGAPQKVGGRFQCEYNKLTSLVGAPQKVGRDFFCYDNDLTSLEGAPQEVGGDFRCYYNKISEKTLKLVWETIQKNKIDYWTALCILKCQIESEDWEKMSEGLENKMAQMAPEAIKTYSAIIKGASILGRFDCF